MIRLSVLALLLALGACTDFIGPDDPDYEELCTIYAAEGEVVEITKWQLDNCERIRVVVVHFPDA